MQDSRYSKYVNKIYDMSSSDRYLLLCYLLGYFSTNTKFFDSLDHWFRTFKKATINTDAQTPTVQEVTDSVLTKAGLCVK